MRHLKLKGGLLLRLLTPAITDHVATQFHLQAESKRAPVAQNGESFPVMTEVVKTTGRQPTTPHPVLTTLVGRNTSHGCRVLIAV